MENPDRIELLEHLAATALDDDYYVFRPVRHRRGIAHTVVLVLALVAGGVVVGAAGLEVREQRSAAELERRTLIDDVVERQAIEARNRAVVDHLRLSVADLGRDRGIEPADTRDLEVVTGAVPVHGPGLQIRITNGSGEKSDVTDADLQFLASGLWHAGAEAVSIDGERIGTLTSIRRAGEAITVNYRSVRAPYVVLALGRPETLQTRFDQSPVGRYWEARHRDARIGFDVTRLADVTLPAVPARRMSVVRAEALAKGR